MGKLLLRQLYKVSFGCRYDAYGWTDEEAVVQNINKILRASF